MATYRLDGDRKAFHELFSLPKPPSRQPNQGTTTVVPSNHENGFCSRIKTRARRASSLARRLAPAPPVLFIAKGGASLRTLRVPVLPETPSRQQIVLAPCPFPRTRPFTCGDIAPRIFSNAALTDAIYRYPDCGDLPMRLRPCSMRQLRPRISPGLFVQAPPLLHLLPPKAGRRIRRIKARCSFVDKKRVPILKRQVVTGYASGFCAMGPHAVVLEK